jgi:hypothetical protein
MDAEPVNQTQMNDLLKTLRLRNNTLPVRIDRQYVPYTEFICRGRVTTRILSM